MINYRIRDYESQDFNAVMLLWDKTGMGGAERGDDKETIERSIGMGGKLLILEDMDKKLIAGTSWMTFDGRRLYLHHFGILPDYQGNGLSKPLLAQSLEFVKAQGHQVKIEVHRSNKKAIKLYIKSGFKDLGDYQVMIIRNTEDIKDKS